MDEGSGFRGYLERTGGCSVGVWGLGVEGLGYKFGGCRGLWIIVHEGMRNINKSLRRLRNAFE